MSLVLPAMSRWCKVVRGRIVFAGGKSESKYQRRRDLQAGQCIGQVNGRNNHWLAYALPQSLMDLEQG